MGEVVTTRGNATIIHENDIHFDSNLDQLLQQVHCMIAAFMSPLYTLYSKTKWFSRKRESNNGQISILNHLYLRRNLSLLICLKFG
jgi:hypothetical protein